MPASDDFTQEQTSNYDKCASSEFSHRKDENQLFVNDQSKHNCRKPKSWKDNRPDQPLKWSDGRRFENGSMVNRPVPWFHSDDLETSPRKGNLNGVNKPVRRSDGSRYNERLHCCHNRTSGRYDQPACYCYQHNDYKPKLGKPEPKMDVSKRYFRGSKYNNQTEYLREGTKTKTIMGNNDSGNTKKVWEPRTSLVSADITDWSADVVEPVKLIKSSNRSHLDLTNNEDNDLNESKGSVHIEPEPENGTSDLSTSSSISNSDSCSSCVSEGDGATSFSSNPQNPGSLSTSDSESASQHSDVMKDTSLCFEKSGEFLSKTSEVVTRSHSEENSNIIPPLVQAQSVDFPVFQPPSRGYYHHGPVPWTTGPPNGLAHLNHYSFASPFGYSLNRSSSHLQYGVGGLQPLGSPLNHDQLPACQSVQPVSSVQNESSEKQNVITEKTQQGNTGFSLFHFGGPVDISSRFKVGPLKEKMDVIICSKTSALGDSCGAEEYKLFAASNGIQFSFF